MIALCVAVCGIGFGGAVSAADTVQVNIRSLLNARSVTTFSNGKLYTWTMGIDGGGGGDGYGTHSAALHLTPSYTGHTLPDSALYPANSNHPKMILNFSNSDSASFQTHYIKGTDSVTIHVPQGNYSGVYLALMSAEGSTAIKVVLNYSDGPATSTFTLNDYNQPLATGVFHVDSNMQKWSTTNVPVDNAFHNLDGFCVTTNSAKTLDSVKLVKQTAGSYVTLWGVTGVGSNITTSASQRAPKASFDVVHLFNSRDGRVQFSNVKTGAELSVYSLSGERVARIASVRQGTLTLGNHNADATVCPGVYICELRQGQEIQRVQAIIGR
jgi:hypothetical protein